MCPTCLEEVDQRIPLTLLPQLQERQRWATASRNFAEGDVVLLVDDCAPRNSWIMG